MRFFRVPVCLHIVLGVADIQRLPDDGLVKLFLAVVVKPAILN